MGQFHAHEIRHGRVTAMVGNLKGYTTVGHRSMLKGSGHYWQLLKIIISIKPHFVNEQCGEVDGNCEKRLPLK